MSPKFTLQRGCGAVSVDTLLLASAALALGVGLGFALARLVPAARAPERVRGVGHAAAPAAHAGPLITPASGTAPTPARVTDPQEIARKMLADGYPREVVLRAVMTAIQLRNRDERRRITGIDTWERWQSVGGKRLSPEAQLELQALQKREEAELARLTGADVLVQQLRGEAEQKRLGALPTEKIAAVLKLEAEHRAFQQKASEPLADGALRLSGQTREVLEREFIEDLKLVLNPAELADYLRYNTDAVHRLQRELVSVNVDKATYEQLADAVLALAARTDPAPETPASRIAQRAELHAAYRQILGDDKFLQMAPDIDRVSASIDKPFAAAGLNFRERAELFATTSRSFAELASLPRAQQPARAAAMLHELVSSPRLSADLRRQIEASVLAQQLARIAGGG